VPQTPVLPTRDSLTLGDAIRCTAEAFDEHQLNYGHGTENAIDEASWLLLDTLGMSPLSAPSYTYCLSDAERQACDAAIARRIDERRPTAYLTGTAWFAGHAFHCDDRALVPRSPLAEWINANFFGLLPDKSELRVLDLCTGGGCIAIACAHALPHAQVDASDISADALALAQDNIALHKLQDRVNLVNCSLFEALHGPYDLIVANPPYVDASDLRDMPAEFHHEPAIGLASGEDGLDFVRQLLAQSARYLCADGLLVVEVGNSAEALQATYPAVPFMWLEFQHGGDGVFVLTRRQLDTVASVLDQVTGRP